MTHDEEALLQVRAKGNFKVGALDEKPELSPTLHFVWVAFCELNGRRATTNHRVLAVSLQEMGAYLDIAGIDDWETRARIIKFLMALDAEYVKRTNQDLARTSRGNA